MSFRKLITLLFNLSLIKILKIKDEYLPFLSEISTLQKFPYVQVDMGAVRFMCKGANLMRPGIKKFSEFAKNDIVCISMIILNPIHYASPFYH